jgi:hypothetical protein
LLLLLLLQVYQENIYQDERPFLAARKVMKEMGDPYASGVELLSFHTVSKVSSYSCMLFTLLGLFMYASFAPGAVWSCCHSTQCPR